MRENYLPVVDVAIRADFDQMRSFAQDLHELARDLSARSGFVHCEALNHDLTGHLQQVEKDWTAHRSQLQSFLSETANTIVRIVAEYEKTNDTVASAATVR